MNEKIINNSNQIINEFGEKIKGFDNEFDVVKNETVLSNDVVVEKLRDTSSNTTYWLTTIPSGYKINIGVSKHYETNSGWHDNDGFGTDYEANPKLERCSDFARRKKANVVINGGIWGNNGFIGPIIVDGEIKTTFKTNYYTLGFKDNNEFVFFPPQTTSQSILDSGIKNCVSGFVPVVMDGVKAPDEIMNLYVGGTTIRAPRQCIGIKQDGTIIILTCDGRINNENGMLMEDLARLMLEQGCYNAYNLDGGGSTTTVVNGVLQNIAIDDNRRKERKVANFIYFKKESNQNRTDDLFSIAYEIEKLKRQIDELSSTLFNNADMNKGYIRLLATEGFTQQGIESHDGNNKNTKLVLSKDYLRYWDYNNSKTLFNVDSNGDITTAKGVLGNFFNTLTVPTDCNAINKNGIYWTNGSITNSPGTGALLHIALNTTTAVQFLFAWRNEFPNKRRSMVSGVWTDWV